MVMCSFVNELLFIFDQEVFESNGITYTGNIYVVPFHSTFNSTNSVIWDGEKI